MLTRIVREALVDCKEHVAKAFVISENLLSHYPSSRVATGSVHMRVGSKTCGNSGAELVVETANN
jgi:hypothetical protein